MTFAKKALLIGSLLAVGTGMSASAADRLSAAGATFPAKIYQRWFADLAKAGGPRSTTKPLAQVLAVRRSSTRPSTSVHRMIR